MSAELKPDFHLEIAHVLFMDIVGYSKLLINEQAELLQELNRIVRNTSQFRNAEAVGELIRLPTGDGMALVFYAARKRPFNARWKLARLCEVLPKSAYEWECTAVQLIRWRTSMTGQTWPVQASTSHNG